MKTLLALCALTVSAIYFLPAPSTHEVDVKALTDNELQWNQDFLSKDPAKLGAHYADDAVLLVAGYPAIEGRTAIQASFAEMTADPAFVLKLTTKRVEVASSGDLGVTEGTYAFAFTNAVDKQVIHDHGNYVTTYRKIAGSWKAVVDASVSDIPPAPPSR